MAKDAAKWVAKVFKNVIEDGKIIISRAEIPVKEGQTKRTGAQLFVPVETFAKLFEAEILAGGNDIDIANAIAANEKLGYGKFIADMAEKGLFG